MRNGITRLPSPDVPSPKQHHRIAVGEPRRDLAIDLDGRLPLRAVDEDGSLQLREQAEQRPAGDLALGDEFQRRDRAQRQNVDPRGMVGDEQKRPLGRGRAAHAHMNAEHVENEAVIEVRNPAPERQAELDRDPLQRNADEGRDQNDDEDAKTEPIMKFQDFSSSRGSA